MILENTNQYQILQVFLSPDNAFEVPSVHTTSSTPIASTIVTSPSNISTNFEGVPRVVGHNWVGKSFVEFATSGIFGATLDIYMLPSLEFRNQASQAAFQTWQYFHNDIVTIQIASSEVAQTQVLENENLSLTFFILFFASFDVAMTLYDHSYETVQRKSDETSKQSSVNGEHRQGE